MNRSTCTHRLKSWVYGDADMMVKLAIIPVLMFSGAPALSQTAQTEPSAVAIKAADLPNPPVIAGDISDRPYTVIG